jgi:hypothetical protein
MNLQFRHDTQYTPNESEAVELLTRNYYAVFDCAKIAQLERMSPCQLVDIITHDIHSYVLFSDYEAGLLSYNYPTKDVSHIMNLYVDVHRLHHEELVRHYRNESAVDDDAKRNEYKYFMMLHEQDESELSYQRTSLRKKVGEMADTLTAHCENTVVYQSTHTIEGGMFLGEYNRQYDRLSLLQYKYAVSQLRMIMLSELRSGAGDLQSQLALRKSIQEYADKLCGYVSKYPFWK